MTWILLPFTERSCELRARMIFSKQKYGMFSLTFPASSMNSV